jgi:hypothetical protein
MEVSDGVSSTQTTTGSDTAEETENTIVSLQMYVYLDETIQDHLPAKRTHEVVPF